MKHIILYGLLFFLPITTFAQETECACCTEQHSQFDFWIGDWEVFNENGDKVGENLVIKLEDNCILNENWKAENGSSGKSYNYYDPSDKTWNQLWISNFGNILKLKGKAENNKMILKSEVQKGKKGEYYNQITWTKNQDGSITQHWQILDAQENFLSDAFKGVYRKKQDN
ncbi:hypothetical protein C8P64_3109 [Christiangramia gaetbulicola]|uniref:Ricin-type beta-trefoil lectin protein n=1 Tax=Christiangramia gaetbulicola TaxID=703340 RepID=A0A2T6ACR0_9FLAO|nr:hypothetical protein [Christiangramia gaetbulicola]PTX41611.1 hypothetical protein C8P64_3109 [Christiangramia gaetbulicola]